MKTKQLTGGNTSQRKNKPEKENEKKVDKSKNKK